MKIYVKKTGTVFVIEAGGECLFGNTSSLRDTNFGLIPFNLQDDYDLVYQSKQKVGESYRGQDIIPVNEMILADPYSNRAYCYVAYSGWQVTGQKESEQLNPDTMYKIIYLSE